MDSTSAIGGSPQVMDALKSASRNTGTDFDYLYRTALRESGLKSGAEASTSSAVGLFQFVEQTWLQTVKETGWKHGLSAHAEDISRDDNGRYIVADPQSRREILALRNDPAVAAVMAGELTEANRAQLTQALGREPSEGELYIGHFLGPEGAARLIRTAIFDREASAADLFPSAARANRSIFYDSVGRERSAGEVYQGLVRAHSQAAPLPPDRAVPRDVASPLSGMVAFFEGLFSGATDEVAAPAASASPSREAPAQASAIRNLPPEYPVRSTYRVIAYWPEQEAASAPMGDAQSLLARRHAGEAYGTQARIAATAGGAMAPPPSQGTPWGGGLFTNTTRASGPLILTGALGR